MILNAQRPIKSFSGIASAVDTCKPYNNKDISTAVNLGTLFALDPNVIGVHVECLTGTMYVSVDNVAASAVNHTAIRQPGESFYFPYSGGELSKCTVFGTTAGIIPCYL
jgi:hypothetical protein